LPQAGVPVTGDYIRRRDVADDAVNAAIARHSWLNICQQVNELLFAIGLIFPLLPIMIKLSVLQELAGVNLELVGLNAAFDPKLSKISAVALESGAKQVRHPMRNHLKTCSAQEIDRLPSLFNRMPTFVER